MTYQPLQSEDGTTKPVATCSHEAVVVSFDETAARGLDSSEVRKRWPRFWGNCPTCGGQLIKYASFLHYMAGDW